MKEHEPVEVSGVAETTPKKKPLISPRMIIDLVIRAVRTRIKSVLLTFGIGICMALAMGALLGKKTWEASGTLLYTPLPVPENQKGLYTPPDMQTQVSLIKSTPVLTSLIEEFQLTVPTSLLDKLFKVVAPKSTQTVSISFQWAESDVAVKMTDRLMQHFIDLLQKQRMERLGRYLEDYEIRLKEGADKYRKASEAFDAFLKSNNLGDSKSEMELIQREMATLREAKTHASRTEQTVIAQKERLVREIEDFKKRSEEEEESDKKFEAAQESLTDNRRRQDRLRELIEEEKKRQEFLAELTVKRREYEQLAKLRATGAVSRVELDEAAKNVEILTSKLTDTENVKKWKEELTNIDAIVVPKGKSKSAGSPIIQQTLFRKLEFDLQLIGLQKEMFEVDKGLAAMNRRQEELRALSIKSYSLQKDMESLDTERNRLAEQVALFQRLREQKSCEFTVILPAISSPYPVASSKKIWLIIGFGVTMMIGMGSILGEQILLLYREGQFLTLSSGIDQLTQLDTLGLDSTRRLATSVRRWLPEYGVSLLWTSHPGLQVTRDLVRNLATVLTARKENILLLDCRPSIEIQKEDWASETEFSVVQMPADIHADGLATPEAQSWFEKARKNYSLVLILGPDTTQPAFLELLDQYTDGICILAEAGQFPKGWSGVLRNLNKNLQSQKRLIVLAPAKPAGTPSPAPQSDLRADRIPFLRDWRLRLTRRFQKRPASRT